MSLSKQHTLAQILGESIILAGMQISWASVEMSSKFSVRSFSKDQYTLNSAANAVFAYIQIGSVWTIGTSLILHSQFGVRGGIICLLCNLLIMAWVVISYVDCFKEIVEKYKLQMPSVFTSKNAI